MDLIIRVREIKGDCPVFGVGDTFIIKDGYKLESGIGVCMHSLASIMPFYNALRFAEPGELGLEGEGGSAYVQCPDPCGHTGGGTVVFEIIRREN
jgi:uncharacterized repeat protein (TIGR04076 family)